MVCVYTNACIRAYKEERPLYFNLLSPKKPPEKSTCMHAVVSSQGRGVGCAPRQISRRTHSVPCLPGLLDLFKLQVAADHRPFLERGQKCGTYTELLCHVNLNFKRCLHLAHEIITGGTRHAKKYTREKKRTSCKCSRAEKASSILFATSRESLFYVFRVTGQ